MTQLRRGRHGLPREEVTANQRSRMFRAMAESMEEKGYVVTSVAEIIRRAGVSRETFYQQFTSKQDCFIAGYEWAVDAMRSALNADSDALVSADTPYQRFSVLVGRYLQAIEDEPARARLFMVEVYAAGPELIQRRVTAQQELVAGLAELFSASDEQLLFACEALVAATLNMVTVHLALNRADRLKSLREPLVQLATTLFPGA